MHLEQAPSLHGSKIGFGTVAVVDMVGYSTLARMLEENMGPGAVADLNRQIQEFVQNALRHLDAPRTYTRIAETGDGAILLFDSAHDAHVFGEQLHRNTAKHNRTRNESTAMRWFRIGIATGELNLDGIDQETGQYAGVTIANAVRLEAAAESGEIVMDLETFGILPKGDRTFYGPEITVRGKRDEAFIARRYKVVNSTQSPEPEVKRPSRKKLFQLSAAATAFMLTLLTLLVGSGYPAQLLHVFSPSSASTDLPVLRSIEAEPIAVHQGDTLVITVGIDRPAPKNGLGVVLSSSDPSVLPIKGQVAIDQGEVFGTREFQVPYMPNYRLPIRVVASYNGTTVSSAVSVASQPTTKPPSPVGAHPTHTAGPDPAGRQPASTPATTAAKPPPALAPLNPEMLSRLEEAQGRLSGELGFWETMKKQMPPGTSLRPEITSQIYAAQSTSRRCTDEQKASDAASLGPCIDSLNDHLNQLKLQH